MTPRMHWRVHTDLERSQLVVACGEPIFGEARAMQP
jgi:hypothetical protein